MHFIKIKILIKRLFYMIKFKLMNKRSLQEKYEQLLDSLEDYYPDYDENNELVFKGPPISHFDNYDYYTADSILNDEEYVLYQMEEDENFISTFLYFLILCFKY